MKKLFQYVLGLMAGAFLTVFITACETTEGMGRDMQSAGEAVEEAAED